MNTAGVARSIDRAGLLKVFFSGSSPNHDRVRRRRSMIRRPKIAKTSMITNRAIPIANDRHPSCNSIREGA